MSTAREGGAGRGDQPADYELIKADRLRLPGALAEMFPSEEAIHDFLQRDMGIPLARIPLFRSGKPPEEYWRRILDQFDTEHVIEAPYRRLYLAVQARKVLSVPFDWIYRNYLPDDGEAGEVAGPRTDGCHVILRTETETVRQGVLSWLRDELLEPEEVWRNDEMTSFKVNQADATLLEARIFLRYPYLLVKVIPPGEPDLLIDRIIVRGARSQELPLPRVPIQLTVAQLGESAAWFHPAAASASTRPADGARRAPSARRISGGGGANHQVPLDSTLLQCGFRGGDTAVINTVRFQVIRVVFVGASPRSIGDARPDQPRVSKELHEIRRKVNPRHFELVGEFPNATRGHLAQILQKKPDIIHIACHGADGKLFWEDAEGDRDEVPADWLAKNMVRRAVCRVSGILLSACHGETIGPVFIESEAARTVIAHHGLLPDNLAIEFTAKFYDELSQTPVLGTAARLAADGNDRLRLFPPDMRGD